MTASGSGAGRDGTGAAEVSGDGDGADVDGERPRGSEAHGERVDATEIWVGTTNIYGLGREPCPLMEQPVVAEAPVALALDVSSGRVLAASIVIGGGDVPQSLSDDFQLQDSFRLAACNYTPLPGVEYAAEVVADTDARLTLVVRPMGAYDAWCAQQVPLPAPDDIRPRDADYVCRIPMPARDRPEDAYFSLAEQACVGSRDLLCRCTAQGCQLEAPTIRLDFARSGDQLDGATDDLFSGVLDGKPRMLLQRVH